MRLRFVHRHQPTPPPPPPHVEVDAERRTGVTGPLIPGGVPVFVTMTDEDVLRGRRGDPGTCALALAVTRALANTPGQDRGTLCYDDRVQRWVEAFDAGAELGPIDFWLTPPRWPAVAIAPSPAELAPDPA